MSEKPRVKVFISYTHDNDEHRERVLELAQRLRREGVDAWIDRFEPHPPQGWEQWMRERVDWADFILVICTETYRRRFEGREQPGKGDGGSFEGLLLREELYEQHGMTERIIPVGFSADEVEHRPTGLRTHTYYALDTSFDELYFRLTGQPDPTTKPVPVGVVRSRASALPPGTAHWTSPPSALGVGHSFEQARSKLIGLLTDLFTTEELRRFITGVRGGQEVLRSVVDGATSRAQLAREVVGALERNGLVDGGFWAGLEEARPGRQSDISRVRSFWTP